MGKSRAGWKWGGEAKEGDLEQDDCGTYLGGGARERKENWK